MPSTVVYVGAVVMRDDEILLVRQSAGHDLEGQWTIPWGRVEEGESPLRAAIREIREEAGIRANVDGLLGVQELPSPQDGGVALVYLCSHLEGSPAPLTTETDAARYCSIEIVNAMTEPMEPWSNWLIRRVLAGDCTVTRRDPSNPLQVHGSFL